MLARVRGARIVRVIEAGADARFGTGPTDAIVYRILHAQPSTDAVPEPMRLVVQAALAKEPKDRPAAHEILDQLGSAGPVPTRPAADIPVQAALSLSWAPTRTGRLVSRTSRRLVRPGTRALAPEPAESAAGRRPRFPPWRPSLPPG